MLTSSPVAFARPTETPRLVLARADGVGVCWRSLTETRRRASRPVVRTWRWTVSVRIGITVNGRRFDREGRPEDEAC